MMYKSNVAASLVVCNKSDIMDGITVDFPSIDIIKMTNSCGSTICLCPLPNGYQFVDGDTDISLNSCNSGFKLRNYQLVFLRKLVGTYRSLIASAIKGLKVPYTKLLNIYGPGYKSVIDGNNLVFSVGYSHKVILPIESDISVSLDANGTVINLKCHDKQRIGAFAAKILHIRKPNRYKQCGIYDSSKNYIVKLIKKK